LGRGYMRKDEKKISMDMPKNMHLWVTRKSNQKEIAVGKYIRELISTEMQKDRSKHDR
tara:strand:+ start:5981 stop:6154 length:174 start_codon:yes stop_codon:yes gene_type:complete